MNWLAGVSRSFAFALQLPLSALTFGYFVYGHARFGCTLGKYVMRIRVVRVDGERIGMPEALKRSAIDGLFAVLHIAGAFSALAAITEAEFAARAQRLAYVRLEGFLPSWSAWVKIAGEVWFWSEFVVMLFNQQRRALHDFIAGTIVVSLK